MIYYMAIRVKKGLTDKIEKLDIKFIASKTIHFRRVWFESDLQEAN